ncbi:hypothetical protein LB505_003975 [Fusarium chuoi]|nr:hypothetical protein LB505_003975 [Fusarium chuoi]
MPFEKQELDGADKDLGTSPLEILPSQFSCGDIKRMGIVTGKSGKTYWLNLDDLGGYRNGPNSKDRVIQTFQNENSVDPIPNARLQILLPQQHPLLHKSRRFAHQQRLHPRRKPRHNNIPQQPRRHRSPLGIRRPKHQLQDLRCGSSEWLPQRHSKFHHCGHYQVQ